MNILILSCETVCILTEKESIVGLSKKEKLQISVHRMMCKACKIYKTKFLAFETLIRKKITQDNSSKTQLSEEKKSRIINTLNDI